MVLLESGEKDSGLHPDAAYDDLSDARRGGGGGVPVCWCFAQVYRKPRGGEACRGTDTPDGSH